MQYKTAYDMIDTRIKRNEELLKYFDLKNKLIKLMMVLMYRTLKNNDECIEIVKKVNTLEKNQLYEYDINREQTTQSLIKQVNILNSESHCDDSEVDELKSKIFDSSNSIKTFNNALLKLDISTVKGLKVRLIKEHDRFRCI